MLVLLAQATHDYRAHLACGVLREHGVEAHVFHENSGVLHGGASTTTASLWVRDDAWQDAHEILATAPIEPLPEGHAESMNISRDLLPPVEAVAVGVAGSLFAASMLVTLAAVVPELVFLKVDKMFDAFVALLWLFVTKAGAALAMGLMVGLLSAPAFAVIRWHRSNWWPALALMTLIGVMLAVTTAMCGIH